MLSDLKFNDQPKWLFWWRHWWWSFHQCLHQNYHFCWSLNVIIKNFIIINHLNQYSYHYHHYHDNSASYPNDHHEHHDHYFTSYEVASCQALLYQGWPGSARSSLSAFWKSHLWRLNIQIVLFFMHLCHKTVKITCVQNIHNSSHFSENTSNSKQWKYL